MAFLLSTRDALNIVFPTTVSAHVSSPKICKYKLDIKRKYCNEWITVIGEALERMDFIPLGRNLLSKLFSGLPLLQPEY